MEKLPHLFIQKPPLAPKFAPPRSGGGFTPEIPSRNKLTHGSFLKGRLSTVFEEATQDRLQPFPEYSRNGVYIEVIGEAGWDLHFEKLDLAQSNIHLLNVRKLSTDGSSKLIKATVFVPDIARTVLFKKLDQYLNEFTRNNNPKNLPLINGISNIQNALLNSFWTDKLDLLPKENEPEWVEVWLRQDNESDSIDEFQNLFDKLEIPTSTGYLRFPERYIKLIFADRTKLVSIIKNTDFVAEFRKSKTAADFWTKATKNEQLQWIDDLLGRVNVTATVSSSVCILDTGVNSGHPLLTPFIQPSDCLTYEESWGTDDHKGHGTLMAGVSAYGNLVGALESSDTINVNHCLESVKILPPKGINERELWGYVTAQGMSRIEIQYPNRNRCFCLPVTADDDEGDGRPTSWSAEIDKLAFGEDVENNQRLILISAGNSKKSDEELFGLYPHVQANDTIQDPAHSWNALTVGAFTELDVITDSDMSDYSPVAKRNELSPFTTTSLAWEDGQWPLKPELVLEGGNLAAENTSGFVSKADGLSLLSTNFKYVDNYFNNFQETSASTALLGYMAGNLQAQHPEYWPETIRALLVHSASWPEELKAQFISSHSKTELQKLLRICGYGVPNLDRALFSAKNLLTLVSQNSIQPFIKSEEGIVKYNEMHLHELPWPREVLLNLPDDTPITMKVTLSYFIEPSPGERGWKSRYRYASHGLTFKINSPLESKEEFLVRINTAARDEDEEPHTESDSGHWTIGRARNKGSVRSDIWKGTASQLAESNYIAIVPTVGWWKDTPSRKFWNKRARYSLVVSIEALAKLSTPAH